MTTMTSTVPAIRTTRRPGRVLAVTRLVFANKWTVLYLPTIILLAILAMNLTIWLLIIYYDGTAHLSKNAFSYSGALFYVYIYMLVLAVQAVARTFPFALGYGATRRAFSLGAGLAFVILALIFSVLMTGLAMIERATNGWGIHGEFFSPLYYRSDSYLAQFGMYLFGLLFCLFLGSAAAAVFVRWRATGLVVFFILIAALLLGSAALIIGNNWGAAVVRWASDAGVLGVEAWSLALTAVFAVAGYFILRRATPRS
ncbi:MAG: transporter permease [Rhizobacter sp.]|nr:transporter permease [Rhizobacter sp.]